MSSSLWDDLPRRMLTIGIGVPLLWAFWWHSVTRWFFFQGLHVVLCLEYTLLVASSSSSSTSSRAHAATTTKTTTSPPPPSSSGAGATMVWLWQHSHLWQWIPVSVVLINITNETFFLLALVVTEALFSIGNASSSSSSSCSSGSGTGWLLLLTLPGRSWIILSRDFCDTVSLLLTIWNCDTGALVVGRLYQSVRHHRHSSATTVSSSSSSFRLWSWLHHVSPSKSLAGFVGGWLFGTVTFCSLPWIWSALHARHVVPSHDARSLVGTMLSSSSSSLVVAWLARFLLGTLVSLTAMAGDLWESAVKRYYGVKDTSQLLPGHGGILDRFDSSLIAVLFWQWAKEQGLL